MLNCLTCKKEINPSNPAGITINNYCLPDMPLSISICKNCSEEMAIDFMSGKLPSISGIMKIMKGLKK